MTTYNINFSVVVNSNTMMSCRKPTNALLKLLQRCSRAKIQGLACYEALATSETTLVGE